MAAPTKDEFRRADGRVLCDKCGKEYYKHPMGGPLGWSPDGPSLFLHLLCDGSLVKL